jgi:hypothetical protein
LLAAFRTADKFWNSVSGIETNGQAAVLVSREGIPVDAARVKSFRLERFDSSLILNELDKNESDVPE